ATDGEGRHDDRTAARCRLAYDTCKLMCWVGSTVAPPPIRRLEDEVVGTIDGARGAQQRVDWSSEVSGEHHVPAVNVQQDAARSENVAVASEPCGRAAGQRQVHIERDRRD